MNGRMIYRTENMAKNNPHTGVDMTTTAMQLDWGLVFLSKLPRGGVLYYDRPRGGDSAPPISAFTADTVLCRTQTPIYRPSNNSSICVHIEANKAGAVATTPTPHVQIKNQWTGMAPSSRPIHKAIPSVFNNPHQTHVQDGADGLSYVIDVIFGFWHKHQPRV